MNPYRYNGRKRTSFVLACLFLGGAGLSSKAHAQAWLPDRAFTEGPGIRAGDLEVHPGVAVRGGYDTNVFRADGERRSAVVNGQQQDVTQRRVGSGILAVTPHIHLSTLSEQRQLQGEDRKGNERPLPTVAFRGGAAATYFHYFRDDAPKNLEVDTDLWLGILPQRPFNIDLNLAYVRSVRPFTQNAFDKNAYNFNGITPRARINFGSRSQVLTGYVGYAPRFTLYESEVFNYLNNLTHGAEAGASWRFLPNTALVYDANVDFQDYKKDDPFNTRSPVVFADNTRFRTRLGINGAVTRLLALRVMAGYAAVSIDDSSDDGRQLDNHEDVVGEAVLTYRFGPAQTSSFEVGYQRDVYSSALGGWNQIDRGFAALRSLLGGAFLLSLEGGATRIEYGRLLGYDKEASAEPVALGANGDADRHDVRVDGALRGQYRVTNWLSFMADLSVQALLTDFRYAVFTVDGSSPIPDPARFYTVTAFGGVRAHY